MSCYFIVNVEGAIVRDDRYLIIERGQGEAHAPGLLSLVGGKVEASPNNGLVLETTLRREIREEVGLEVADNMDYLESKSFVTDDGDPVVDVVFLCRYEAGTATARDPAEVTGVSWMTAQEILDHPDIPEWTAQSIRLAEERRVEQRDHGKSSAQ